MQIPLLEDKLINARMRQGTVAAAIGSLAVLGTLVAVGPASAAAPDAVEPRHTVVGGFGTLDLVAFDEDGTGVPVSGEILSVERADRGTTETRAVTIAITAGTTPEASIAGANNDGRCGNDGSSSVKACITIYYNIKNSTDYYFADATSYDATWTRLDTQATLANGRVTAYAGGLKCGGGSLASTNKTWNHASPSSGATYTHTPPWKGTYVSLANNLAGQSVQTVLTWQRGTATYTLFGNYTLPEDGGWPQYGGCV